MCSTARRTVETADRVVLGLGTMPEIRYLDLLYGARPSDVVDVLGSVDDAVLSVLVVGHNPTVHALSDLLPADRADRPYPTAGLAVYRFGLRRWEDVAEGTAVELGRFAPPY